MIVAYIDTFFSLLPVLFFFIYWNQAKSERGLWLVVVYSLFFFCINILITSWKKIPLLYDSLTLVEFLLFSWFLVTQLATQTTKKILVFLGVLYTIFYVAFTFYTKAFTSTDSIPENTAIIDSIPIGIEAIIVLVFSFYYLYEQMRDTTNMFIYNTFQFWIVLGMVLYLAGSFFIYIFSNNLSGDDVKKYWVITNFFSILRSIFFTIAIIQHAKPTKNRLLADFEVSYLN